MSGLGDTRAQRSASPVHPPAPLDDIRTFVGSNIPADEYASRAKLRTFRNAASAMVASTESADARCLAWMVIEKVSPLIYLRGLSCAELDEAARFAKRLLLTAMQAEILAAEGLIQ